MKTKPNLNIRRTRIKSSEHFVQPLTGSGSNARVRQGAIFIRGFLQQSARDSNIERESQYI